MFHRPGGPVDADGALPGRTDSLTLGWNIAERKE
jgi:hypothetical protein